MKRLGIGKISYNQHRWDSSGFHYQETINVSKAWAMAQVLRPDFGDCEISETGIYLNNTQTKKLAELAGWRLKYGYNTFLRFVS